MSAPCSVCSKKPKMSMMTRMPVSASEAPVASAARAEQGQNTSIPPENVARRDIGYTGVWPHIQVLKPPRSS